MCHNFVSRAYNEVKTNWRLNNMFEEKFANEVINDEELEGVAGGTRLETFADGNELYKRGLISRDDILNFDSMRDMLHKMGYTGYKYNGDIINGNIYTDKNGNMITRDEFWKNFDAENGTKIIR